ncbi:hypothetical protein [Haloarcula sp. 1CSR25-25]|uniref:hypothetical protein n=1 Tax=Haloarcula sp. 1CSR25-25 TaxID=2862545 RepID=UPI002893EE29|nr:hypothetical protein [Haloarcula sp. 1CSR25-25]MDT3434718.1 hypothetical protein [Haloarcula sp. 1CSR25-25]
MIIQTLVPVLRDLGIFAVGATVAGWVAKEAITNYFDKELTKYEKEVDKELNRFQAELEKDKLQFSQLHNERAKITAELYKKFVLFEEDMRSLVNPVEVGDEPSKDEKFQPAAESGNEFRNYYMKNKIYFPADICQTIESLDQEMESIYRKFGIFTPYQSRPGDPQEPGEWLEVWERVTEDEVPELKEELEDHFRELLGVDVE